MTGPFYAHADRSAAIAVFVGMLRLLSMTRPMTARLPLATSGWRPDPSRRLKGREWRRPCIDPPYRVPLRGRRTCLAVMCRLSFELEHRWLEWVASREMV
jgi:hypothetical protein